MTVAVTISQRDYDVVLFDLDGVLGLVATQACAGRRRMRKACAGQSQGGGHGTPRSP